jgi:hypothetical protein
MKKGKVFIYEPVGLDVFDKKMHAPALGARVVKTQPYGCPRNGTMGMCYVQGAESGEFHGLVLLASLRATNETAVVRDLAAEARDRQGYSVKVR